MKLRILPGLFLLFICNCLQAQIKWELNKDKNNIKVFTAKEASSKFKAIKVEAVMPGTIQKLAAIIRDVSNNKNWVYNTKQSYVLKRRGLNDILYYLETDLPWPVDNRDVAIRMKLDIDSMNNSLKVNAVGELGAVAEKKGLVRISYFNSSWQVKAISDQQLFITYILRLDPGGSLPASVTNLFISKGPYETFYSLAQLLKK